MSNEKIEYLNPDSLHPFENNPFQSVDKNTDNLHCHIVVNSVSFVDGKKFNDNKAFLNKMRNVSDTLCKEQGLSVIENPKQSKHQCYPQYIAERDGEYNKFTTLKKDIDECILRTGGEKGFLYEMQKLGYKFDFTKPHVTVNHPSYKRPIWLCDLGDEYSFERISQRIYARIDTAEIETEIEILNKKLKQLNMAKEKLGKSMDMLDVFDELYNKKYDDMQMRLDSIYHDIDETEKELFALYERLENVRKDKISQEKVYQFLLFFDIIYPKFTDAEKKEFLGSIIERVEINPEPTETGQILKKIKFRIPVSYYGNDENSTEISVPTENLTVETVVLLSKREINSKKVRVEFSLEDMDMSDFQDSATYTQIKDYVLEHRGLKVPNLYISQIKRKCGIEAGKNYNLPKSEDYRQPQCPPEKEKAIREAFEYFGLV